MACKLEGTLQSVKNKRVLVMHVFSKQLIFLKRSV
jgi:hypothetical protein